MLIYFHVYRIVDGSAGIMKRRKTDQRIRYTKMVIKQSLLDLMKKKPINKITVSLKTTKQAPASPASMFCL